jgi:hypothetical protein
MVVRAIRFTVGDQRASISSMIPAIAGPVAAKPVQKRRLIR